MKNNSIVKRLRNVSIAAKLYFTVSIMALLIGVELFALFFCISTLSSVRAYVGGEGLWSKAQKDALYHLLKYGSGRNEEDYEAFKFFMKVPAGDSKARLELGKAAPNWSVARQGFIEGRNHPEDVDGMIKLFRRFSRISYISKAISIWAEAEPEAFQLLPIAEALHEEIHSPAPSQTHINNLLRQITPINQKLTVLEDDFSYTLGEGSRWLEGLVLKLLFSIAFTVEVSGLFLAISLSRGIQKDLSELLSATKLFSSGNLKARARVCSEDEIGVLANAFNRMSDLLEKNIVEQKQIETALKDSEDQIQTIFANAPDAIVVTDSEGVIAKWNPKAESIFGWRSAEAVGKYFHELIIPARYRENYKIGITHFLEMERNSVFNRRVELTALRKDDSEFDAILSMSPSLIKGELFFIGILNDITERKKNEETERRMVTIAAQNKELESFAYIISHDLKTPLRGIANLSEWISQDYKDKLDETGKEYLSLLINRTQRLESLINGVLSYSKAGRSHEEKTKVDAHQVLMDVVEMIAAPASVHISVDNLLPTIGFSKSALTQVFSNLIGNAIKHNDKASSEINVGCLREQSDWKFYVKDNGPGIDKKFHDKAFQMFQTLKTKDEMNSTGIGLAIVKKIIENEGGRVWVESSPGLGAAFYFTIHRAEVPLA